MTTTTLSPPVGVASPPASARVPARVLVLFVVAVAVLSLAVRVPILAAPVQVLGLLFIPGLCAVSLGRLRGRGPVELGVVVMAASVAADLVLLGALDLASLPLAGFRPLDRPRLEWELAAIWLVLALAVYRFGDDLVVRIPRRPTRGDLLVVSCAGSAVVQAVAGAWILNRGGPGGFAVVAYLFVAAAFVLMVWPSVRRTTDMQQFGLVLLAMALLLSNSLRSPVLSGNDANVEFQIASMVQAQGTWDPAMFRDAFMACLSSSLFTVVLSNLSGLALMLVFKVAMPALFALIAAFVFGIARRLLSERGAVAATFFFIVQPGFQQWVSIPVRQEVALLLFAASVWALLTPGLSRPNRVVFFWLASLGMLVSHYSTVYIACLIYLVALAVDFVSSRRPGGAPAQEPRVLNLLGVLALGAGAIVWYGPVTTQTYAVVDFLVHSANGLRGIFDPSVQQQGQSVFSGFGIFGSPQRSLVPAYVKETTDAYRATYAPGSLLGPPGSAAHIRATALVGAPVHQPWASFIPELRAVAKVLALVLVAIGAVSLGRRRDAPEVARTLTLGALLAGAFLVLLPFISISYDLMRLYQQLLVLLAPALVLGAARLRRPSRHRLLYGSALLVVYFALLSRLAYQLSSGPDVSMTFNNRGWDYATYYVHPQELAAGRWLANRWRAAGNRPLVFADSVAASRLRLVSPLALSARVKPDLLPTTFVRGSYLYLDQTNIALGGTVIRDWKNTTLSLTLDRRFFDAHLNRVYSTSGAAVYH